MDVCLGKAEKLLGRLIFIKDGPREFSQFAYSEDWLADNQFFNVAPDMARSVSLPRGTTLQVWTI